MNHNFIEIIIGFGVVLVAVLFVGYAMNKANISTNNSYVLSAAFDNIDGINQGSDVRISGVKIGKVSDIIIDNQTFMAKASLNMDSDIQIPTDSSASIVSSGLLGSKYIAIIPGGAEENLSNGDEIILTQSSVNFEDLLGRFIFGSAEQEVSQDNGDKENGFDEEFSF